MASNDIIFINNLIVYSQIGIHRHEKLAMQRLLLSLDLHFDFTKAVQNDSIESTINYSEVIDFIVDFSRNSQVELIETFANNLINQLFQKFMIKAIKLHLTKPQASQFTREVGLICYRENNLN